MLHLRLSVSLLLACSWQFRQSLAKLYTNAADLPGSQFDYIIIGGGTGGNVIANRLTEDSHVSVLVLEAGGSNEGVLPIQVPFLAPQATPNTPQDWNYTTTSQAGFNGRSIPYPRGHVLGGSSSVNYLVYTRGSSDDFDRLAKVSGDSGWSWNNLKPYIAKNEKLVPPADNHNTNGQFDPHDHSTTGINSVSLASFPSAIDKRIIQTTKELSEFPFNLDMNSGNPLGLGWVQTTIGKGARSSSATSYLGPNFINRPNLSVLVNAQVAHLLKSGTDSGLPAFKTVEYRNGGQTKQAKARKEVILCAGSIGTPQVLLNSGIGDPNELQQVGVTPTFKLPDVGRNLVDHTLVFNTWSVNSTDTWEKILRDPAAVNAVLGEWQTNRTGFMTDGVVSHITWKKTPKNSPVVMKYGDPSAGPNSPNIELMFSNGFLGPPPPTGNFITIIAALVSPMGKGSVKLASNDPFKAPLIDPGLLTHGYDIGTMVEAVKMSERLLSAPVWKDYVLDKFGDFKNTDTDDQIIQYLRKNGGTVFHPVGTASMSKKGATTGVVDPNLKVKGISGLRVVDASIFPYIPSVHTQAPVYIIAERAADLIKSGV